MQKETMTLRPRRAVLYMPGSNARALEKARDLPVDAVIFDLEDAVSPDAKELARTQVVDAVKAGGYGRREVVVRINGIGTQWGRQDLEAAVDAAPDAILVPKVSTPADLTPVRDALAGGGRTSIWAMMETPFAMLNALAIASSNQADVAALSVMVMGTNDLAKETRAHLMPGRSAFVPWLATCIAAARAHGLDIIDGVFNDIADEEGLRHECEQGRELGMDGKTLIHPKQIEVCKRIFSPSSEEIAWAKGVCEAFDRPENARAGVLQVGGKMVERLHAEVARRILAIAEAL